jgi:nicotinate dehydrogenase subunit B
VSAADTTPAISLPSSLGDNPRLSSWIEIGADDTIILRTGKVELGQGIATALAQLAADALGVDVARLRVHSAATDVSPNESFTAASLSVEQSGAAVRQICAEVRAVFLDAAAARLGSPSTLRAADGLFVDDTTGAQTSYWELAPLVSLDRDATGDADPGPLVTGAAAGRSVPRLDLLPKFTGQRVYVQDVQREGMVHARVVHPAAIGARLESVGWEAPDGVKLVRDGSFLAVVAAREEAAVAAAEACAGAVAWGDGVGLPGEDEIDAVLRAGPCTSEVLDEAAAAAIHAPATTVRASYSRPFLAHASIGPSCAVAEWEGDSLRVWCSVQSVYNVRVELARVFGLELDRVVVQHVDGSGCYGHNGADDAAYEAALVSRELGGTPVRLQWSRADELACAPYGSAMSADAEADLGPDGRIVRWKYDVWSLGHNGRPGLGAPNPNFLSASSLAEPFGRQPATDVPVAFGSGTGRNAVPLYSLPTRRVEAHVLQDAPIRTSSLRSLGAHLNVFAIESFMDELAHEAGADPVEFRLRHLGDERARAVIERAAAEAAWGEEVPQGRGRGLGFARYKNRAGYCAIVAEVDADTALVLRRLTAVVDVGFAVNPDGVASQVSGGALQAASWTILEQVRFDERSVTSTTWEDYPILRFTQVPEVHVTVLDRPDDPPLGAGEIAQGPAAAAIGNAVFAALGVRVRDLPISYERIVDTINA